MQRIRRGIKVDTATERWCSMKEIMEHLGVSRDTVLPWIDKKYACHKNGQTLEI